MDGIIKYEKKRTELRSVIPVFPGVSMPGRSVPKKVKTRKTIHSADDLWVAPRAPSEKPPRIYEPIAGSRLNRYLEFADIALGVKQAGVRKKKAMAGGSSGSEKSGSKTIPINRGNAKRGFGAFRNSR
jgi:hypothetical protein